MKLTVQKTYTAIIDTFYERERINKAFQNDPTAKKKLLRLIDFVERQEWEKAKKLLESKWFRGRDSELGCPREEFVGMLFNRIGEVPVGFDSLVSYSHLVNAFTYWKDNYKVLAVDK